jgi:hypothetical protein
MRNAAPFHPWLSIQAFKAQANREAAIVISQIQIKTKRQADIARISLYHQRRAVTSDESA